MGKINMLYHLKKAAGMSKVLVMQKQPNTLIQNNLLSIMLARLVVIRVAS